MRVTVVLKSSCGTTDMKLVGTGLGGSPAGFEAGGANGSFFCSSAAIDNPASSNETETILSECNAFMMKGIARLPNGGCLRFYFAVGHFRISDGATSSFIARDETQFRQNGPMIGCSDRFIQHRVTPRTQSTIHKDV